MFAYCNSNPVSLFDSSGNLPMRNDRVFINDGVPIGISNLVYTVRNEQRHAHMRETVGQVAESVWNNIDISAGIGLGLYGEASVFDNFGSLSGGLSYDLISINLAGGKWSINQKYTSGLNLSVFFYELCSPEMKFREMPFDGGPVQWTEDNTRDAFELVGGGAYLFGGASLHIGFDFPSFYKDIARIYAD